jgi:5-methylcytosine-specific restriction endonuclease McrA
MNETCKFEGCGGNVVLLQKGPNHYKVCLRCEKRQHDKVWLSKVEAGVEKRSLQTTHESIRPKTRSRIFDRAGARCEICGASSVLLTVGHFLSVAEGQSAGLSDDEINSDDNLFCCCEECNAGQGAKPVSIKILVAIIRGRLNRDKG